MYMCLTSDDFVRSNEMVDLLSNQTVRKAGDPSKYIYLSLALLEQRTAN